MSKRMILLFVICLCLVGCGERTLTLDEVKDVSNHTFSNIFSYDEEDDGFTLVTSDPSISILVTEKDSVSLAKDSYVDLKNECGGFVNNIQNIFGNSVSCKETDEYGVVVYTTRIHKIVLTITYDLEDPKAEKVVNDYLEKLK